jgi:hypothetical protein
MGHMRLLPPLRCEKKAQALGIKSPATQPALDWTLDTEVDVFIPDLAPRVETVLFNVQQRFRVGF